MPHYLIHCCNNRMWYVKEHLIPSMLEQGIPSDNILVYQDINGIGNLRAFVDSCNKLVQQSQKLHLNGVWHLQDDVVLSKDFAKQTTLYDTGIVCGFTCAYSTEPRAGMFKVAEHRMWFSFPCIRIPTYILREFVEWANLNLWQSQYFNRMVKRNNADDLLFREWLYDNFPFEDELNLAPNLVNHVDKLIGGSVTNKSRDEEQDTMSIFWDEPDVIDNLKNKLNIK